MREKPLRLGTLYRCSACKTPWFIDAFEKLAWPIQKRRLSLFERWCEGPLLATVEQLAVLKRIGAPLQGRHEYPRRIEIPCRVRTRDGTVIDPAVIRFQDHPPIEVWPAKLKLSLVDEVASIAPSDHALSLELRNACRQADDVSGGHMMAFPTRAVNRSGNTRVILDGCVNVLHRPGLLGSELVLERDQNPASKAEGPLGEPHEHITYFIGDWIPKLEALRS